MIPEPARVDVHGVGTVQEILKTAFYRRAKARPHTEVRPPSLAIMGELERRGFRKRFAWIDPYVAILFADWIRAHPMVW